MPTEDLRQEQEVLLENYQKQVHKKLNRWREAKEQIIDAICEQEKQRIEDDHQAQQLELEQELQNKLANIKTLINCEEEDDDI